MAAYNTNVYPPVYASPMHQFVPSPEIHKIRGCLPWSIINILLGWLLGGVIALICSIMCRDKKRRNDVHGARSMSTLALVINIISTLVGIAGWIFIIWYIVLYVRLVKDTSRP